jgi:predicted transcriptional regulator
MPRKGITVYLPRDLELRVERIARDQHRSASGVIAEAVKARLERKDVGEEPARRQIARVDARLNKTIGETLIVKETLLLFIRIWLEHNPPLDPTHEDAAAASAEARFARFLELIAQGLQVGSPIAADGALREASAGEGAVEPTQ